MTSELRDTRKKGIRKKERKRDLTNEHQKLPQEKISKRKGHHIEKHKIHCIPIIMLYTITIKTKHSLYFDKTKLINRPHCDMIRYKSAFLNFQKKPFAKIHDDLGRQTR